MFVELKDANDTVINISQVKRISLVQVVKGSSPVYKGALELVGDEHTIWFDGQEFERVKKTIMRYGSPIFITGSNDLKTSTSPKTRRTNANRPKQTPTN